MSWTAHRATISTVTRRSASTMLADLTARSPSLAAMNATRISPLTRVRETQTILEPLGAEVIVQIYPGAGHGITEEEVRFARGLLNGDRN